MPELDAVGEAGTTTSRVDAEKRLRVRWLVGGGSAVAGAILAIASYWIAPVRICRESACNPWGIAELIPFLVISLLAILPDLSEVTIGSIVSLKRRVDIQQGELDKTIKRQESVEQQVMQLTSVSTNQHVTQQFFNLPPGSAAHLPDAVNKKKELLDSAASTDEGAPSITGYTRPSWLTGEFHISNYSPENARNALRLIEQWEGLDKFIQAQYPFDSESQSGAEQLLKKARRNFSDLFGEEIHMVRSVRNSIAHARYVPPEDLLGALRAAEDLNEILGDIKLADLAEV